MCLKTGRRSIEAELTVKKFKNIKTLKKHKFLLQNSSRCVMIICVGTVGRAIIFHHSRKGWLTGLHGQAVKTSPFHGGNTGSIPVGVIQQQNKYGAIAKW